MATRTVILAQRATRRAKPAITFGQLRLLVCPLFVLVDLTRAPGNNTASVQSSSHCLRTATYDYEGCRTTAGTATYFYTFSLSKVQMPRGNRVYILI